MILCAQDINKFFHTQNGKQIEALKDVGLSVRKHEFVAIVGPSGCGKSTLLNVLAGLYEPDTGQVLINGSPSRSSSVKRGHISQADTLLPWRTIMENVELGLEIRGMAKKERREIAAMLIKQVGLGGFEKSYPFELSGGMRKRAIIIRTLAYAPEIIFMDEPFVGLDVQSRDELMDDILKLWQETKKTILFVTHDLAEAITLADRVILMSARPATVKAEYLVSLPRPRSVAEIKFTPQFIQLHKRIWGDLSNEVMKSYRNEASS
ncbi:ABC transporter [Thermincola ferriacetica]|uniref:ABC transporter n=1 Tax=Thermincola ferriacetica TaxID=281456 RepID=A0A0L6W044_9FIRM|nr:ABC transporter [Thermincola ferriacetica]